VVGGILAGILFSPSGIVSEDNYVFSLRPAAANISSVSNQADLNAALADCAWESDFVNAVARLLDKGASHSFLSHTRLLSIYDLDQFWPMIAGAPWTDDLRAAD